MARSGYSPEEQLQYLITAARNVARRTGTVRQTDLRLELAATGAPIMSESSVRRAFGYTISDIKRHVIRGDPLAAGPAPGDLPTNFSDPRTPSQSKICNGPLRQGHDTN